MELGTGLALASFAEQCLKYGNKFVKRCKSYLHAEEESLELLVTIESNWLKMETQIKIVRRIAPKLNRELQDMQSQILSQLEGKLKTASLTMDQLMKQKEKTKKAEMQSTGHRDIGIMIKDVKEMTVLAKVRYTSHKKFLLQIVEDIEKWQLRYDPSWILIMQISIGNIDEELDQQQHARAGKYQIPIVVAAKGIRDAARERQNGNHTDQGSIWIDADLNDFGSQPINFSSIRLSSIGEDQMVLIDTMTSHPAANVNETIRKTQKLARILTEVEPTVFGLLKCRGVIKRPRLPEGRIVDFDFIFDVPQNLLNPRSLRAVLLTRDPYPLNERLHLAKRLTSSVLFVHTVQFVHKNVRPETVIIFESDESKIGAQFLAGFEQFRPEDGSTYRAGDGRWERNLYRHPSRQGLYPEVDYQMQHDIYSLGVVLLEIGLWTSFVEYDQTLSPTPNLFLQADSGSAVTPIGNALEVKKKLEALAELELPARLGKRYTDIVLLCLRCLDTGTGIDHDEKGFGVDVPTWTDEDGIVIGVRYIENVLEKIQEITL